MADSLLLTTYLVLTDFDSDGGRERGVGVFLPVESRILVF